MALLFGNITDASIIGDTVWVTGSNWVALAFDRDDPVVVTRLHGIHRHDGLREDIATWPVRRMSTTPRSKLTDWRSALR